MSTAPKSEAGRAEVAAPKGGQKVTKIAPTLYLIIVLKILKGLLFVGLAFTAYMLSDNDLPAEYHHWLHIIRANPERKFWSDLAVQIGNLTEANMRMAAIGTLVYSLFSWVEGIGLMFRISWAGWLSIGESAFFIPIEIFELIKHFTWPVFVILILNIFIVWYLFSNRDRLFKHHH
ncbi:MAG: hypothetical protein JWR26_1270 [Pedosphaera sp.]|nr:hypothetical protein [Pedosphaera sp.]